MKTKRSLSSKGFTLIEILFAFVIMAISVVVLMRSQQDSIQVSLEGERIIIASELARMKLLDCKFKILHDAKDGFSITDFSENGDFKEEGHPDMSWTCSAKRLNVLRPNLNALAPNTAGQPGQGQGALLSILGPVFSMMTTNLGKSARELNVEVKFKTGLREEEIKLTTHVVNTQVFARSLSSGG